MISLATLLAVSLAYVAPAAGPCDLLAKATITGILGQPSAAGRAQGPEKDDDTDGMMSLCTFQVGQSAMIVSELTFASQAAAMKAITQEYLKNKMDDEGAAVKQEAGAGDRAYWATTKEGAQYVVVKGANVFAVAVGGTLPKPTTSYHDALRAAALEAAGVR